MKLSNWFSNLQERIYYLTHRVTSFFRGIWYSVSNLYHWFPIIWHDRNWDYFYIIKILQFKLKAMHKVFKNDNLTDWDDPSVKDVFPALEECIVILNRITEDIYWKETDKGEYKTVYEACDAKESADYTRLFELMSKYLRGWWN